MKYSLILLRFANLSLSVVLCVVVWELWSVFTRPARALEPVDHAAVNDTAPAIDMISGIKLFTAPDHAPVVASSGEHKIFRLTGVFVISRDPDSSMAVINDGKKGDVLLKPGEPIEPGVTLEKVLDDSVVLRNGDAREQLGFPVVGDSGESKSSMILRR